ncbi:hypothetical protein ACFV9C_41830 [Kribbella sp. NPDC059898]|uniref:hypothetical protein n=1 Tax=Kribbella sp. NPDC059898 TaxID=3346995 RepID=UPI00365B6614
MCELVLEDLDQARSGQHAADPDLAMRPRRHPGSHPEQATDAVALAGIDVSKPETGRTDPRLRGRDPVQERSVRLGRVACEKPATAPAGHRLILANRLPDHDITPRTNRTTERVVADRMNSHSRP